MEEFSASKRDFNRISDIEKTIEKDLNNVMVAGEVKARDIAVILSVSTGKILLTALILAFGAVNFLVILPLNNSNQYENYGVGTMVVVF